MIKVTSNSTPVLLLLHLVRLVSSSHYWLLFTLLASLYTTGFSLHWSGQLLLHLREAGGNCPADLVLVPGDSKVEVLALTAERAPAQGQLDGVSYSRRPPLDW